MEHRPARTDGFPVHEDSSYTDHAFQATFHGKDGVTGRVANTYTSIKDRKVKVVDAFRCGDRVAVRWEFSGIGSFAPELPPSGTSGSATSC